MAAIPRIEYKSYGEGHAFSVIIKYLVLDIAFSLIQLPLM